MDWVEGVTLDKYVHQHISDKYVLQLITYQFCKMAAWLMSQPFAHGDLKPDNILVTEDGTLVLVDYDGMYVPAMQGQRRENWAVLTIAIQCVQKIVSMNISMIFHWRLLACL